jgi:hypothetical protein
LTTKPDTPQVTFVIQVCDRGGPDGQEFQHVTVSNSAKMNVLVACHDQFDQILANTVGTIVGQLLPMSAEAESVLWGDDTHLQKRLAHIAAQGVTSPELSGISSGPADSPMLDTVHKIHAQLTSPDKDTITQAGAQPADDILRDQLTAAQQDAAAARDTANQAT